jgi:hypothetical protein
MVFDTCRALIGNLPALQHSELNPSDVATQPHEITHQADAVRYLCVHRALGAQAGCGEREEDNKAPDNYDKAMRGGAVSASYLGYA